MPRRRRTVAQHAHLRSPHPLGQFAKVLAVAVTVVLVAVAGVAAYTAVDLTSDYVAEAVVVENQPPVPPDLGQLEGGVNMMVVGIDACEENLKALFGERCEGPDAEGQLNDVNILLHISDAPRRVTVVSFPRDLLFEAPACDTPDGDRWGGGYVQINEIYSYGGLSCVMTAISDMSGQSVQFGAMVTFGGVIEVTNAIGGVEICLASPMRDEYTAIDWPAGPRTIQGYEALQFLRTRYGVGGSDLARISNQQQYMSRLARKLVSEEVLSNPATVFRLASTGLRNVTPTQSLTNPLTLVQIASAVKDVPFDDIVFVQYPTVEASTDANRVEPNFSAAQVLWDALAANQGIEVTGDVGANDGVVAQPAPGETATPTETPAIEPGTVDPTTGAVALPESITGSTAAQQTCSNGVVN
ncbi:MAG: transcriptional regulator [Microbacterium sp.]|jgi:LCP family protein required for cell wall assembly|nr:transcriptional regulator [Microbacterium sp.]